MTHRSKTPVLYKPFVHGYYRLHKKYQPMNTIPALIIQLQSLFDYSDCWRYIEKQGQRLYGQRFRLYAEDAEVIAKLITWVLRDEPLAAQWNIDLDKGIMLAGPVGCGKTSLMTIIRYMQLREARHIMKPCRELTFEFAAGGYPVLLRYGRLSLQPGTDDPQAICFDDLGLEPTTQYYGNTCNVMGEVLLSRYDCYATNGMITHVTTNLNSAELEEAYGPRLRSRMRELFNLIAFSRDAPDKRV